MKKIVLFIITIVFASHTKADTINIDDVQITPGGQAEVTVKFNITSGKQYAGWQMDFYLPEGLSIVTNNNQGLQCQLGDCCDETFSLSSKHLSSGVVRWMAFSASAHAINVNNGDILFTFPITVAETLTSGTTLTATVKNIVFTSPQGTEDIIMDNVSFTITIGDSDELQEYLNSLIDTEDNYAGNIYQRQFLNRDWQALYLPFSLSYSDWSAHFDVARINAFYQYDDDEDGVVDRQVLEAIIVRPGNGNLKANHPYLIRAKSKDTFQFNVDPSKMEGEQINSISCSTVEAKYTFTGNYLDMTGLKSAERYRIRGGSLSIPESDEEVLPPYRWYLTIDDLGNQLQPSAAKVRLRIVGDETPTSIDNMEPDGITGTQKAFDISGRQIDVDASLSTLPKGIYIINNKKYIVK